MKQEMMAGRGISWTICRSLAPRSRQITIPAQHHLHFYRPDALPDAQPTVLKHWRYFRLEILFWTLLEWKLHFKCQRSTGKTLNTGGLTVMQLHAGLSEW